MQKYKSWIDQLNMLEHPEGGWYKETYRSDETINALPDRFSGTRQIYTSIYYLLAEGAFSCFHRIKSDELWNFHDGYPMVIHLIDKQGNYTEQIIGNEPGKYNPQYVVPHGCWFAAEMLEQTKWGLVGCTVAPGFDFVDFEMAKLDDLLEIYPQHAEIIHRLTKK